MMFKLPLLLTLLAVYSAFAFEVAKVLPMIPELSRTGLLRRVFPGPRVVSASQLFVHVPESATGNNKSDRGIPSNQVLVQRRLEIARGKKEARQQSIEERNRRNLHIKALVESANDGNKQATTTYKVPALYAAKISVCDDLRKELNLSGRERRGRIFIEINSPATRTLAALKYDIHAFFRALRKSSFVLSASLPEVAPDGSIVPPENNVQFWPIETDQDVAQTFQRATEFFESNNASLIKRPSIVIHLTKDPTAPQKPPPAAYLRNMSDPALSPTMTMLSFYSFPPGSIHDPENFALALRKKWKPFQVLGRVYVAEEGVNAQMSVPTNILNNFIECCRSIPELEFMENGVNVDPKPLDRETFATAGVPLNGRPSPPFRNLHIRVRNQIVADGLDKPLNWQSAGYDMPPLEWHQKIKEAKQKRESGVATDDKELPIILDCRNDYETNVGIFEGAEPLDTSSFRESWEVLEQRLEGVPKDAPIMTYCTGGIRCVKVGAYLTQELGFKNVSRLAGGIISYDRTLCEQSGEEEPFFKGTNFVFDGRLGRQITDDELGTCVTCGGETSLVSNCLNENCHKRMIQCEKCRTNYHGTCSDACKLRLVKNDSMRPRRTRESMQSETEADDEVVGVKYETIDDYSAGHSTPPPSFFEEIELNTRAWLPSGSHMVSGAEQGRLLKTLASMTREGRILEVGTFTGYATCALLEGAANAASVTGAPTGTREGNAFVLTLERDARAFNLAVAHAKIMAKHGMTENASEAACALRANDGVILEEREKDIVSVVYDHRATCEFRRVSDALASLEEMARGESHELQPAPFDMVFIDADKTRLLEYAEACLDNDRVLKKGGLIVVDNVLWKGLVLEASSGGRLKPFDEEDGIGEAEVKKNRRARKLASKMHHFNSAIVKDDRVDVQVLSIRDGLSIIHKR